MSSPYPGAPGSGSQPPQQPQPGSPQQPGFSQPPAYGQQPGMPPQGGQSAPPKKKSKAPKILIIVGAVILALSVVVGIIVTVVGALNTAGSMESVETFSTGSGTFTAEEGQQLIAYAPEGATPPSCNISGPGQIELGDSTTSYTVTADGQAWTSFDDFTVDTSGDYMIDCYGEAVAIGPPPSVGGILGTLGGVLLGVFGGFLGFVLLVIGIILLVVQRRKNA